LGPKNRLFAIGQAAKMAGVSRQSVQYYLMVGLLEPTQITKTSRRLFDQTNIERIRLIKKLNASGYTLRAIRELFFEGKTGMKGNRP
jgi:DNA-binding transcriptional MerR regulator